MDCYFSDHCSHSRHHPHHLFQTFSLIYSEPFVYKIVVLSFVMGLNLFVSPAGFHLYDPKMCYDMFFTYYYYKWYIHVLSLLSETETFSLV